MICSTCNGSGEGPASGTSCRYCKDGVIPVKCKRCDGQATVEASDDEA